MDNFAQFETRMQPQTYFPKVQQQHRPHYPQMTGAMIAAQSQQKQALISPGRVQSPLMAAAATAVGVGELTMATKTVEFGQFENGSYTPMIAATTAERAPGQLAVVEPSSAATAVQQFMMGNIAGSSIAMMQSQAPPSRLQQEAYVCSTLTPENLRENVYKQVSYYLSRTNLASDYYLIMNMDEDSFVEIALLATFKRLRSYTSDITLIANILLDYPNEFDISLDRTRIRPMFVLFTEIWLHDCPPLTTPETVKQLFDFYECPKFDRALPKGDSKWTVGYLLKSEAITANKCLLDKKLYIRGTEVRTTLKFYKLLSRERAKELFYKKQQALVNRKIWRGYARANNEASAANQQQPHDVLAGQAAAPQVATNNASGTNNSSGNTSGRESCSPVANEVEDAGALPAMINMQQNQMIMQQMPVVQQPQSLLSQPVPQQASMPPPPLPHQYPHNQYQRRMDNNHQQKHHNAAFTAAAVTFGAPMNGGVGPTSQQVPYLINYVAPTQISNAVAAAANAQPMQFSGINALNGLQPQQQQQTSTSWASAHLTHYHCSHHNHCQQQHGYNKNFSDNTNWNFFFGQQRGNGNYFDNAGNGRLGPISRPPPHHNKSYSNQMYCNYNYNYNLMKNNDWQMRKSTTALNIAMQGIEYIPLAVRMQGVAKGIDGSTSANTAEAFGSSASTMPSVAKAAVGRFDIEQARFPPLRPTLPQFSSSSSQQQQQLTGTAATIATTAADNATSVTATNTSSTVTVANSAVSTMATASSAASSVIKKRHVSTKPTAVTNKLMTESFPNTTVDTLSASVASMSTATVSKRQLNANKQQQRQPRSFQQALKTTATNPTHSFQFVTVS